MAENKMEQIAAMFGKKLGEEFTVGYSHIPSLAKYTAYRSKVKFTEEGLYTSSILCKFDDELLVRMLRGLVEIVEDEK